MTLRSRRPGGLETALLWAALAAVHLVLGALNFAEQLNAFGDVTHVYRDWSDNALAGWVPAIDGPWVYPLLGLIPMLLAAAVGWGIVAPLAPGLDGGAAYGIGWLIVVFVATSALLAGLTRPGGSDAARRARFAGAWWLVGLTLALGPIATGRIDAITLPIAVAGLLLLRRHPAIAGAAFAIGAWIKVWPAAPFLAAVVGDRRRWRVFAGGAAVTAAVVGVAAALGGWPEVTSFITEQTGRGLQIESPAATVPMLLAAFGDHRYDVGYDTEILTVQITGPGTETIAALATPAMVVLAAGVAALGIIARRCGASAARLIPPLGLSLVVVLVVTNKVGSPQFAVWMIAVVVAWVVQDRKRAAPAAIVTLLIALLTQLIYPWAYPHVMTPTGLGVLLLVCRNALDIVLLALGVAAIAGALRDARRARRRVSRS